MTTTTEHHPHKYLLDSNVYDLLVATPETHRRAIEAHQSGRMELLLTHIQVDELMDDEEKRHLTLSILGTPTLTYGVVLTKSKLGLARWSDGVTFEAITKGNPRPRMTPCWRPPPSTSVRPWSRTTRTSRSVPAVRGWRSGKVSASSRS